MQESSIAIAVATHKPYRMPEDSMYLPIHVGKALHPDRDFGKAYVGDNTGDNISDKNAFYSELTGLYWMWKNNDSDYKGLVHYRRHFKSKKASQSRNKDRFKRIITSAELLEVLQKTDVVVAKKRKYYIESVYSHYAHTFHSGHFDLCREVLQELCPEFVPAWDKQMKSTGAHLFNMFVMSREKFDEYCAWMFPILFEMEKQLDPAIYNDAFQARYLGRVSEVLLDPWLETKGYSYVELPVVSPEPVNWWKKGTGFLLAKFGIKKYSKSF